MGEGVFRGVISLKLYELVISPQEVVTLPNCDAGEGRRAYQAGFDAVICKLPDETVAFKGDQVQVDAVYGVEQERGVLSRGEPIIQRSDGQRPGPTPFHSLPLPHQGSNYQLTTRAIEVASESFRIYMEDAAIRRAARRRAQATGEPSETFGDNERERLAELKTLSDRYQQEQQDLIDRHGLPAGQLARLQDYVNPIGAHINDAVQRAFYRRRFFDLVTDVEPQEAARVAQTELEEYASKGESLLPETNKPSAASTAEPQMMRRGSSETQTDNRQANAEGKLAWIVSRLERGEDVFLSARIDGREVNIQIPPEAASSIDEPDGLLLRVSDSGDLLLRVGTADLNATDWPVRTRNQTWQRESPRAADDPLGQSVADTPTAPVQTGYDNAAHEVRRLQEGLRSLSGSNDRDDIRRREEISAQLMQAKTRRNRLEREIRTGQAGGQTRSRGVEQPNSGAAASNLAQGVIATNRSSPARSQGRGGRSRRRRNENVIYL